jgi:hypothetical protein
VAVFVAHAQAAELERRNWFSQAKVRSTTQRGRPSRSLDSTPRRAIRRWMPRLRKATRHLR